MQEGATIDGMEGNQNLARLAELINLQRSFYGLTVDSLAKKAGVGLRTLHGWLRAENAPGPVNRSGLERALGWSAGSVTELLDADNPARFTLDRMQSAEGGDASPVVRARDLTDDELFLEVSHRLRLWHEREAAEPRPEVHAGLSQWAPARRDYDLAADSTPEEKGSRGAPDEA